jgi:hypothetical protein
MTMGFQSEYDYRGWMLGYRRWIRDYRSWIHDYRGGFKTPKLRFPPKSGLKSLSNHHFSL